jgi:hypothetical protein
MCLWSWSAISRGLPGVENDVQIPKGLVDCAPFQSAANGGRDCTHLRRHRHAVPLDRSEAHARVAPVLLAIALVAMIAIGAIRYWSFHSTSYEITPDELVVRFWPFRLHYRLASIAEVYPTPARRPRGRGWNFTTSLDYVYITFRLPNRNWTGWPIAISPADKSNFLRELAERVPGIKVVT